MARRRFWLLNALSLNNLGDVIMICLWYRKSPTYPAGFAGITWPVTSQLNKWRNAARRSWASMPFWLPTRAHGEDRDRSCRV
jgi:hypothetical protein